MKRWAPAYPIQAFVGFNGSGKSIVAVETLVIPALRAGYWVASNISIDPTPLRDPAMTRRVLKLQSWVEIPRLGMHENPADSITNNRPCVLLLDEANAVLPARQWSSTPAELLRMLDQLRKQEVCVGITAPDFGKIEKSLRGCIQIVRHCEGFSPDKYVRDTTKPKRSGLVGWLAPGYPALRGVNGRKIEYDGMWLPTRRFQVTTYKADQFEDFSHNVREKVEPLSTQVFDRRRGLAQDVMRTRETVGLMDFIDQGMCSATGKPVRAAEKYCDCPLHATRSRRTAAA